MDQDQRKKEQELRELYRFVADQVRAGLFKSEIIERLIELGVDKTTASELVDEMERRLKNIRKRVILLVMPPSPQRSDLEKNLVRTGYEVVIREDGDAAVRELRASVPDLVVAAMDIPQDGPLSFLKQIRRHPIGRRIPVFILTDRIQMADAFKPFRLVEVIDTFEDTGQIVSHIQRILFYQKGP